VAGLGRAARGRAVGPVAASWPRGVQLNEENGLLAVQNQLEVDATLCLAIGARDPVTM
jgi:hypothetical protein